MWLSISVGLAMATAMLLPLNLLVIRRFHHDEALYATWGLTIASGQDIWLAETPIDKPPLFLYLIAGAFRLLGQSETAARLPSLLATALTVGLTFLLGRRLFDAPTGAVAAWLVALSPFSLMFAPTAFTDPTQVTFVVASCLAASYGRAGWAGVLLALASATKQQGLLFAPLALGLLLSTRRAVPVSQQRTLAPAELPSRKIHSPKPALRFIGAGLVSFVPLLAWDLTRHQPSAFLELSLANYGGLATDLAGFAERGLGFIKLLHLATGSVVLNSVFSAGLPLILIYDLQLSQTQAQNTNISAFPSTFILPLLRLRSGQDFQPSSPPVLQSSNPPVLRLQSGQIFSPALLLTLFSFFFLALHAAVSFQPWDRYLLGLIPLLALLLARVLLLPWSLLEYTSLARQSARPTWPGLVYGLSLVGLLTFSLARPVQDAINARYPLGSNSEDVYGIDQIVAYLQRNVGADNTLYHHWLGAHWRFYLWGYPYDLQFWDKPQTLAARVKSGHLIALPARRSEVLLRLALVDKHFYLREIMRTHRRDGTPSIILYRLEKNG